MRGRILSISIIILVFSVFVSATGCSLFVLDSTIEQEDYIPSSLLIVAEEKLYPDISESIEIYRKDLSNEGIASSLLLWNSSRDCSDLKSVLQEYAGKADSAFFIGTIPPAWYEQEAFGEHEVFPSDLYYMDLDSVWNDSDSNGYFDSHSEIQIDFYTSRLTGNPDEINFYLAKLHDYRTLGGSTPVYDRAFLFKDDDWHNNYRNNDFGLKSIYGGVEFCQDENDTTRSAYLDRISTGGYEYIYQWIHAYPPALFIDVGGEYEIVKADDIEQADFKGNFYNLFDCQAARFTVKNIASNLISGTDSCIAILGSTKTGGVYYPVEFHKALGQGACWGAAYKHWYNTEGYTDDSWYLGIMIMGDPAIRLHNAAQADLATGSRAVSNMIPISDEEKEELFLGLRNFDAPSNLPAELIREIEQSLSDY